MFQKDLLRGKRVLVTGGGTGLGKAMGQRFLELGARLAICGRRREVLEAARGELAGGEPAGEADRVLAIGCDVRDAGAVEAMMDSLWQSWGGLDLLVNNAAGNILARSETLSPRAVDAVVGIVLQGSAYCTLAAGRRWIAEGARGNVLSIVTSYAWTGSAYVVPSAMAKAGVLAMTRSLAVEWGPKGIRLNAIAPGPFPTEGAWSRLVPSEEANRAWRERVPLRRFGEHRELADLVAFLASDGSGYINGEVVTIDGGEWLSGAGQFNAMSSLSEAEWEALRPKKG